MRCSLYSVIWYCNIPRKTNKHQLPQMSPKYLSNDFQNFDAKIIKSSNKNEKRGLGSWLTTGKCGYLSGGKASLSPSTRARDQSETGDYFPTADDVNKKEQAANIPTSQLKTWTGVTPEVVIYM